MFDTGSMEPWSASQFEDLMAIDMSNRYFTPRQNVTTDQITTFTKLVDPDDILSTAMNRDDKFTHTMDNEVDYYELTNDGNHNIW
jgi:hypothetical protein